MDYQTQYHEYKALADAALNTYFTDTGVSYHRLLEAMHYSLAAGGKRLRPVLVLAFCAACGGDVRAALPVACAVEMVHTYSLIHDDLPCMDNDDLRRGKPTNHVVFGECTATLAGDALQAEAFRTILSTALPAEMRAECARLLAEAAGENGICGGQQLDMEGEGKVLTKEELMDINDRKTSAMIYAACLMGVTCGGGNERQREAAAKYAKALGLAFQIRDDMLDVLGDAAKLGKATHVDENKNTFVRLYGIGACSKMIDVISTESELGKPIGSDAREGKNTFMALYGLERCGAYVHELSEQAAAAVDGAFADSAFLQQLARSLADRKN